MKNVANGGRSAIPDWLVVVVLVEGACLAIALLMPITPSRTASIWSPASLFALGPSYLERAVAWFAVTNIIVVLIGLVAWFAIRRHRDG
jgi:hypothetical protein